MKTYKHNLILSRCLYDQFRNKADAVAQRHSNEWFVEYTLLQLQHIGEHGLPDCYKQPRDFLYDFWPNLPWNTTGRLGTIRLLLADQRLPAISAAVKESTGLDMKAELQQGLREELLFGE